jgi:hypothetical protein
LKVEGWRLQGLSYLCVPLRKPGASSALKKNYPQFFLTQPGLCRKKEK